MDTPHSLSVPFGTGQLPVEILFVMTAQGGWHVEAVYFRVHGGKVQQHPHWPEGFGGAKKDDPLATWNYLSERYLEDNGGNGMTWDIGGFEVASVSDIAVVVGAAEAELIASPTGPLIAGGTIAATADGVLLDAMPAVVEYADGPILRATGTRGTDHYLTVHRADNGALLTPIGSEDLLAPQVRWPLEPDVVYRVRTSTRVWTLVVTAEGTIATLTPGETTIDAGDPTDEEVMDEETGPVGPDLRIDRQSAPAWVYAVDEDIEWADHCLGGQKEWCWAVPWVFQALAAPVAYGRMPAWPSAPQQDEVAGAGYWNALLYLLTYSFGWSRPDKGLSWWLKERKPQDDPRLQLLTQVWDRDGDLDWFFTWMAGKPPNQDAPLEPLCKRFDNQPLPREGWVHRQAEDPESLVYLHPQGLHLGSHHWTALEEPSHGSRMTVVSKTRRRAIFVAPSMRGWYRALNEAKQYLPQAESVDWKVDVLVRPVGWLGTYRQSWSTGLWFAGQHRFHEIGN